MSREYVNPARITKKQLRIQLNISDNELRTMLNKDYIELLLPLGYRKRQKYLLRHQLDVIFPSGIDFETKK